MAFIVQQQAPEWNCQALMADKQIKSLSLNDYKGKYLVLFYYPLDFTFVCPTEIIAFSDRSSDFRDVNCEVVAASCDNIFTHLAWVNTDRKDGGLGSMKIPILADFSKEIASSYGCLIQNGDDKGVPLRALYIIDGNGVVRHMSCNDLPVGRNVDEALRLVKAFQFVDEHGEVCPANWKPGEKSMKADPNGKLEYFKSAESSNSEAASSDSKIAILNSQETFEQKIASSETFVAFFSASWCGNCKKVTPVVEEAVSQADAPSVVKIDSEHFAEISDHHEVSSLPTFILFQQGKETKRYTGSVKKKVVAFIEASK